MARHTVCATPQSIEVGDSVTGGNRFAGALLDLDGTVYRGSSLIPGARTGIERLRERGIDVCFLTNKAIRRCESYRRKLTGLGISVTSKQILTSSVITADYLLAECPESVSFVVGEAALVEELHDQGLETTTDPERADVVVASMDRSFDYKTLAAAHRAIEGGARFLATNSDRTCPVADGEIPDAAGMIGAIEGVTGRELDLVMGKPSSVAIQAAMRSLAVDPADCLLIGDRLETDVLMGNRAGMTSVLVCSGVTDRADLEDASIQPDFVLETLGEIETVIG
ncbi:MAG: HAD-IIA family hydrolase [Halorhabdus sp.]